MALRSPSPELTVASPKVSSTIVPSPRLRFSPCRLVASPPPKPAAPTVDSSMTTLPSPTVES